jgi:hypothetical protein
MREALRAPVDNFTPVRRRSDDHAALPTSYDASLPSKTIGFMLLEVYFERIYNANILFDKAAFFSSYMEDELPEYLLRAVLSLATLYAAFPMTPASTFTTPNALEVFYAVIYLHNLLTKSCRGCAG